MAKTKPRKGSALKKLIIGINPKIRIPKKPSTNRRPSKSKNIA